MITSDKRETNSKIIIYCTIVRNKFVLTSRLVWPVTRPNSRTPGESFFPPVKLLTFFPLSTFNNPAAIILSSSWDCPNPGTLMMAHPAKWKVEIKRMHNFIFHATSFCWNSMIDWHANCHQHYLEPRHGT